MSKLLVVRTLSLSLALFVVIVVMLWILALAGLLALPAVAVVLVTAPLLALLSWPACWLLLARKQQQGQPPNNCGTTKTSKAVSSSEQPPPPPQRQVIVTGGSSGIGLAIAMEAATLGNVCRIVILARNEERLNEAKSQIVEVAQSSRKAPLIAAVALAVEAISLDVSNANAVQTVIEGIMKQTPKIVASTHLFCCAGEANPNYHHKLTASDYEQIVQTNQLGTIYVCNTMLKYMQAGTLTLTSSMAGQTGVFGFTAYSPTKFALRGYAECLHMELCNHPSIHVQMAYPPDTDTPGYVRENLSKPTETALISDVAGLSTARTIGTVMLREALAQHPRFGVYFNFDGFLLCTLTAGFAPVSSVWDAVAQVSILPLTRWISLFYLANWHRIIRKHQNNNNIQNNKPNNQNKSDRPSFLENTDTIKSVQKSPSRNSVVKVD